MEERKCTKCKEVKPITEFFVKEYSKSGKPLYCSICKKCHCEGEKQRHKKKMELIDSMKTPCVKCGEKRIRCISYHHLNPKEKDFTIAHLSKSNKEVIIEEIKKCVCLCLNCHHEFHYLEKKKGITFEEYLNLGE